MANYASLWTSSSDKEFRQMSKFHSLQRRRLGLQMAGIRKEHGRHVKRVRIDTRETGTLVSQYEDEKERRARHLLKTFSKVQRKRQAAEGWITATHRRNSNVGAVDTASNTFDVEIGDSDAPWGGGKRKMSTASTSSLNTFRSRSRSSFGSIFGGGVGGGGGANAPSDTAGRGRLTGPGLFTAGRSSLRKLPPIESSGVGDSASPDRVVAGFLKTWTTALNRKPSIVIGEDVNVTANDEDENTDSQQQRRDSKVGDGRRSKKGRHPSDRQVIWTKTFPFVYHSVGEDMCHRYSRLFLQYDEFKVHHAQPKSKSRKPRRSLSSASTLAAGAAAVLPSAASSRHRFKSISNALGAVQSLASKMSSLSLAKTL